jgi:hypothetical protein
LISRRKADKMIAAGRILRVYQKTNGGKNENQQVYGVRACNLF